MTKPIRALIFLFGVTLSAKASNVVEIEREEWRVIGWNDACGVAVSHLGYPKLGQAIANEPVFTRIGNISIATGSEKAAADWSIEADGPLTWNAAEAAQVEKDLLASGYSRPGFSERLRESPAGAPASLLETLSSTSTFASRRSEPWPSAPWRLKGAAYNPLSTCALIVFEDMSTKRNYRLLLTRIYNTRVRIERAAAHVALARAIFNDGDVDGAQAEAAAAARLAPESAAAHYEHGVMLALLGRGDEAVSELAEAVKRDPAAAARMKADEDLVDLRGRDDFKAIFRH